MNLAKSLNSHQKMAVVCFLGPRAPSPLLPVHESPEPQHGVVRAGGSHRVGQRDHADALAALSGGRGRG